MRCAIAAAHLSNEPNIVNARDRAVPVIFAAGEGDLELARQIMKLRMPEQITRHAEGVARHVKHFARANAGQRAARDIAHRIAAGFARGQARLGEQPHYRGNVLELHEVELHIFARGNAAARRGGPDRKSTRLNSSHGSISYAVFCLEKKTNDYETDDLDIG